MTDYQEGLKDAYVAFKDLISMPDEARYERFNNGKKISIRTIFEQNSPEEFFNKMLK